MFILNYLIIMDDINLEVERTRYELESSLLRDNNQQESIDDRICFNKFKDMLKIAENDISDEVQNMKSIDEFLDKAMTSSIHKMVDKRCASKLEEYDIALDKLKTKMAVVSKFMFDGIELLKPMVNNKRTFYAVKSALSYGDENGSDGDGDSDDDDDIKKEPIDEIKTEY